MRQYPSNEKDDQEDLAKLNAKTWQIELLKLNPNYVWWGCYEDYMCQDDKGWASRTILENWDKGKEWGLNELNEMVNFYFEVYRSNEPCEACDKSGLNEATHRISEDWYDFAMAGRKWSNKLTEVEIEALVRCGRLSDFVKHCIYDDETNKWTKLNHYAPAGKTEWVECVKPIMPTPDEVNAWSQKGMGHDSINQYICVKARAEHLGVYGKCEVCEGKGHNFTEDHAKVALQLWFIHPRKGCSRGVYIKEIKEDEIPQVIDYLNHARERNEHRFSGLDKFNTQ